MKTKKAWLVSADGYTIKQIPELEGKELVLKDLYPIIGNKCHIVQPVNLKKGVTMWVDEEGLLKPNELNYEATKMCGHVHQIVGNAIVIDNTKAGNFI